MEFGKPKLPTLPSLAFWKQGEDSEIPPPPARHFDPSRFGGEAGTQVAEQMKSKKAEFDQYGMRVKDSARAASDVATNVAAQGVKFKEESLGDLKSKPMRKPYGLGDLGDDEMLEKAENKFNLDSASLKNKFESTQSAAAARLSKTQQDFRSAMNSAADLEATAKGSLSAGSNSFATGDNSFAAGRIAKTVDNVKGISGGDFLPKSDAFSNVKKVAGKTEAAVNGALYDARGRLASSASKAQRFAQSSDANSLKTKFEQRLLAAQKQTEMKSNGFKAGTSKANEQLNTLASVSGRTQDLISKPFPKVAVDGSFIPQNTRPIDLNAGQPALQPRSISPLQPSKPNGLVASSFGAASNADVDSISRMRSEVEETKRELAMLKAQVAAAKQAAAASIQPAAPAQPAQRVAQNTIEGMVLPLDRVNDAFDPRAGSPVANQYQGRSYSPASPQAPNRPSDNPGLGGGADSFYPTTPYGGFGSTAKPGTSVGQVGFNSANEFQNRVSRASVEAPVNTYSGPLQANRIESTSAEVLIPSEILSGSSSFTPGSTTPLR